MIEAIDYQKLADEIVDKLAKSAPPDRVANDMDYKPKPLFKRRSA